MDLRSQTFVNQQSRTLSIVITNMFVCSERRSIEGNRAVPEMFGYCSHGLDVDTAPPLTLSFQLLLSLHEFHLNPGSKFLVILDLLAVDKLCQSCFDLLVDIEQVFFIRMIKWLY